MSNTQYVTKTEAQALIKDGFDDTVVKVKSELIYDTPVIIDPSKVKSILGIDIDTELVGNVSLDLIINEAGKKVSEAIKLDGDVLPTLGDINKVYTTTVGVDGLRLRYTNPVNGELTNFVFNPNVQGVLFWDGVKKMWEKDKETPLPTIDTSKLAKIIDDNGAPVIRSKKFKSVSDEITGTIIGRGYFSTSTGTFIANEGQNWYSIKFDIANLSGELILDTVILGVATAAVAFMDVNNGFLGNFGVGTASAVVYENQVLTIPPLTRYLHVTFYQRNSQQGAAYGTIKHRYNVYDEDVTYAGGSNKTAAELVNDIAKNAQDIAAKPSEIDAYTGKIARVKATQKTINVVGIQETSNGYYGKNTGVLAANGSYRSIKMDVQGLDLNNLYATSLVRGGAVALAMYYDNTGAYISFEMTGVNDRTDTYTQYRLSPPANTRYVGLTRYGNVSVYATLEARISEYPEVAYSGGSTKTLQDLDDQMEEVKKAANDLSKYNVMVSGDSITAAWNRWVLTFQEIGKPLSFFNNAVGSSCWSKKMGTGVNSALTTQNYDDPNFAGISNGYLPTTDPVEIQMRLNNCAVVHIQKFIREQVLLGQHPTPDIIILSYGTNPDWNNGDVASAINGKTIDRDDTYTMTKAMRWCIQELMTTFPNARIFVSLPIQAGDISKFNLLKNTKIPMMREVAQALSVPVLDCFSESGISEKFEVASTAGRHLYDGLHPNATGGQVQGRYIVNKVIQFTISL